MKQIICAAMGIALALGMAPLASADPAAAHYTIVRSRSPSMTCEISSDDTTPGPNVVCQGNEFPGAPVDPDSAMHLHSAMITAAGKLSYLDGNIGEGGDDFNPATLSSGNVYHLQAWTIEPTGDGVTFTNDATGHGMTISADQNVKAF